MVVVPIATPVLGVAAQPVAQARITAATMLALDVPMRFRVAASSGRAALRPWESP
jgi:hypothetical protein